MATILLTGGSGFIGLRLAPLLAREHDVVSLSRQAQAPTAGVTAVRGDFTADADRRRLDGWRFDTLVHLAAVKAHCSEEDGMQVNVEGTRRLVRHLLDRGCRHFVLASSIAAPGCWNPAWVPGRLPIPPDEACHATDAYGRSKWLMEQEAQGFARDCPDATFVCLRLAHVRDDARWQAELLETAAIRWPWLELADLMLSDALALFRLAAAAPGPAGSRVYNAAGPDVRTREPVATVLRQFYGRKLSAETLASHRRGGHEFAPIYDLGPTTAAFGWEPRRSVRPAAP